MSYGSDDSTLEIISRRNPLEVAAALVLGRLLIGWSRLGLALQLYVSALPPGGARDGEAEGLDQRLERLLVHADAAADKALRADFLRWIVRARQFVPLATSLRQGRWLPDPRRNVVLLMGEPGGARPPKPSYTIGELEEALAAQTALLAELHRLCGAERGLSAANAAAFLSTQPIGVVEQPG